MKDVRDPLALLSHAIQAGDWKLVELLARVLAGQSSPRSFSASRAYAALVGGLGLGESDGYDRADGSGRDPG
jgi:hypothetical protein